MSLLTIELVAILLSAWKAPRWVGTIGTIALCTSILGVLFGLYNLFSVLEIAEEIAPTLVYGGCRVALISILYGLMIYIASQVIKIIQKPRM